MRVSYVKLMDLEKKLDEVEYKLYLTRRLVLDLLSKEVKDLLTDYSLGKDCWVWKHAVIERVANLATVSVDGRGYFTDRGLCPLCQTSSDNQEGYSLPVGLTRHLAGTHRVSQCEVMEAAIGVAKYHFDMEVRLAERAAAQGVTG